MLYATLLALILASATPAEANVSSSTDPASLIIGEWKLVDQNGKTVQGCSKAQIFKVEPDGSHIVLTEPAVSDLLARYVVVHREKHRVLMFIENEDRKTKQGDPVLWWAYFNGPDEFRWRRYDWDTNASTATVWKRCRS